MVPFSQSDLLPDVDRVPVTVMELEQLAGKGLCLGGIGHLAGKAGGVEIAGALGRVQEKLNAHHVLTIHRLPGNNAAAGKPGDRLRGFKRKDVVRAARHKRAVTAAVTAGQYPPPAKISEAAAVFRKLRREISILIIATSNKYLRNGTRGS